MNPYFLEGAVGGLADAEQKIRDRKMQDEDRAEHKMLINRQIGREDVADSQRNTLFQEGLDDRGTARQEHAADRQYTLGERDHATKRRDIVEGQQDAAYNEGVKDRDFARGRAKVTAEQQDTAWAQNQQLFKQRMTEEGLDKALDGLEAGMDPAQVEQAFNSTGQFKVAPGGIRYDKATGQVSITGAGGKNFTGSLAQLRTMIHGRAAPIKIKDDERLIDATTHRDLVQPRAGSTADGKTSPYNPLTASSDAGRIVAEELGLKYDSDLQKFIMPEGMGQKVTQGQALAGQVVRHFGNRIMPQEAAELAAQAIRPVMTDQQAVEQARRELGSNAQDQEVRKRADLIVQKQKIVAAQTLNQLMARKELEITQREQAAAAQGGLGDADSAVLTPQNQSPGMDTGNAAPTQQQPQNAVRVYNPQTRSFQ